MPHVHRTLQIAFPTPVSYDGVHQQQILPRITPKAPAIAGSGRCSYSPQAVRRKQSSQKGCDETLLWSGITALGRGP